MAIQVITFLRQKNPRLLFCPLSRVDRFKTNAHFLLLPHRDLYGTLDACKAADYVIFVLSTVVEVDTWGDTALRCLQAQGLPDVTTVAIVSECLSSG